MDIITLSDFTDINFSKAINELFILTKFNIKQYPGYVNWFYGTCIPGVIRDEREIYFALDGLTLSGLSVVKKSKDERKLCTLYVDEDRRHESIGRKILDKSFEYLGTTKPLITIPENRINTFQKIITDCEWKESSITEDYNSKEIIFN